MLRRPNIEFDQRKWGQRVATEYVDVSGRIGWFEPVCRCPIDGPQTLSIRVYDIHRTESVLGEDVKRERSVEEMI